MKKLVIGACALAAVSAMAVESANIVGYNEVSLTGQKYAMLGVNFSTIGETTITLGGLVDQNTASVLDTILIPNASGVYTTYTFIDEATAEEEEMEDGAGWYNGDGENCNATQLAVGDSVWYFPAASESVRKLGEVKSTWTKTVSGEAYTMVTFPFPKDYTLGSFEYVGTPGDTIMIPDAEGVYTSYSYIDEATAEEEEMEDGAGWYNGDGENCKDMIILVGQGFWAYPQGNATFSATL